MLKNISVQGFKGNESPDSSARHTIELFGFS